MLNLLLVNFSFCNMLQTYDRMYLSLNVSYFNNNCCKTSRQISNYNTPVNGLRFSERIARAQGRTRLSRWRTWANRSEGRIHIRGVVKWQHRRRRSMATMGSFFEGSLKTAPIDRMSIHWRIARNANSKRRWWCVFFLARVCVREKGRARFHSKQVVTSEKENYEGSHTARCG